MNRSIPRWSLLPALAAVLLTATGVLAADTAPKMVILGFDGADPQLVQKYMDEGLLPNLEALSKDGTFSPLLPTNPPQTPVSWSSFATGLNPGRTEIFDFLYRTPGRYAPDFALATAGKKTFLFGEQNGLVFAALLGLVLALVLLGVLRSFKVRWAAVAAVMVIAFLGVTFGMSGAIASWLPVEVPTATNNRQGKPFWTVAAESGLKVKVVRVPVTFPAEELPKGSSMISGLGVPDVRRRIGTPTIFTTDPDLTENANDFSLEVTPLAVRRGKVETRIIGPYNYPFHVYVLEREREEWKAQGLSSAERRARETELVARLEASGSPRQIVVPVQLDIGDDTVRWEVSGQSGELKVGGWSDWVSIDFPVNWLIDRARPLRGMGRFRLIALEPEVQLYFSPVNFHSGCRPPIDISWPPSWAQEITEELGPYKTIGWAIDTWSYPSGIGGIDLFLEDMNFTVDAYSGIMDLGLETDAADIFVQIFYFTDRIGHMAWHELDPGHPLHVAADAPRYEAAMRAAYQRMDELVGRAREHVGADTLFLVLSDHGFSSFRRQININTWLFEHGYLALSGQTRTRNLEQLFDRHVTDVNVFSGIDWSRTQAWAMGLGAVYINLVGREPQGVVMPGDEYDRVVREIKEGLESAVDDHTGVRPIFKVYTRDEMYGEYNAEKVADLRVANRINYRVSWQDSLGGLSTRVFEDNDRTWSGDHCSLEPTAVPGILFINRGLKVDDPAILDIAPSILAELGLDSDEPLDGRVIW